MDRGGLGRRRRGLLSGLVRKIANVDLSDFSGIQPHLGLAF